MSHAGVTRMCMAHMCQRGIAAKELSTREVLSHTHAVTSRCECDARSFELSPLCSDGSAELCNVHPLSSATQLL